MIHHLNCATMRPLLGLFGMPLVAHCLLVERPGGLVLVDSGLGMADLGDAARLGRAWRAVMRPALDPAETAVSQVRALGFEPEAVTDIVLTHLDLDHAGGVADFPGARVHVMEAELRAAQDPIGLEHGRYLSEQWSAAEFVTHRATDEWFGLPAVRPLGDDDLWLVALPGHSRGHAGVAVRDGAGGSEWLLHAGDAFFHHTEPSGAKGCPKRLTLLQRILAQDDTERLTSLEQLRALVAAHGHEVRVVNAHDPALLPVAD